MTRITIIVEDDDTVRLVREHLAEVLTEKDTFMEEPEGPIILPEDERPIRDMSLCRWQLDLFWAWAWDTSMPVHVDDSHQYLTNRQLVDEIMRKIAKGESINSLLTEYERRLNTGKGGPWNEEDLISEEEIIVAMGESLHLYGYSGPKIPKNPLYVTMIRNILNEIRSEVNIHGTKDRFEIWHYPTFGQAKSHHYRDEATARCIACYFGVPLSAVA